MLPVARIQPPLAVLAVALGLGMAIGLGMAAEIGSPRPGPVYTLGQLHALLARGPDEWAGRTVLVRGMVGVTVCAVPVTGALCSTPRYSLRDPDPRALSDQLALTLGAGDPLLTSLRREPLLGAILPAAQAVVWGAVATYRVQLRTPADAGSCDALPCVEAVLLDATP
jgi:hypothetical protein